MKAGHLAFVLLAAMIMASIPLLATSDPEVRAQGPGTITMGDFFFQPNSFSVAPGESVSLNLINAGALLHTFTLFDEVDANVPLDTSGLDSYYNTHDKLVDLNFTAAQELPTTFTAPSEEGVYTIVCMISGHTGLGMVGTMTVTSEPPPEPTGIDPLFLGIIIAVVVIVIAVAAVFVLRRRG